MKYTFENNSVIISELNDFDLAETLDCGQAFRWKENDDKSFSGVVEGKICRIKKENDLYILENCCQDDFLNLWIDYFDLNRNYGEIKKILSTDETMAKACEFSPGIRILRQKHWETLCSFIISQNNNIKRIKGIIDRLCENFGEDLGQGFYSFPTAEKLAEYSPEDLSELRAGFRARYIIDAAKKVASKEVDLDKVAQMPLEDARKELMKIVGVGIKVADCALLFGFGRIDAFPKDVWIKRAMEYLFPQGLPKCAEPYGGIAQQYIFNYVRVCPDALPQEYKK